MGVHELYAYIRVKDAAKAIAYYEQVFGAKEKFRLAEPSGRIGHAQLDFSGSTLMISDEFPERGILAPQPTELRQPFAIHLHVDDADAVIERVASTGGAVLRAPQNQFWGERLGVVRDPFGHEWIIGHHIEGVSPDEMQRRYTEMSRK